MYCEWPQIQRLRKTKPQIRKHYRNNFLPQSTRIVSYEKSQCFLEFLHVYLNTEHDSYFCSFRFLTFLSGLYIWSEGWRALKTTNKVPLPGCFKKREKEIVGWGHWMQVFDWWQTSYIIVDHTPDPTHPPPFCF